MHEPGIVDLYSYGYEEDFKDVLHRSFMLNIMMQESTSFSF